MDFSIFTSLGPSYNSSPTFPTPSLATATTTTTTPTPAAAARHYSLHNGLSCSSYGTPTLWGPFVQCEHNHIKSDGRPAPAPTNVSHSFANALFKNINEISENFRCDLKSTNSLYFDAIYQCNPLTTTNDYNNNNNRSKNDTNSYSDSDIVNFTNFSTFYNLDSPSIIANASQTGGGSDDCLKSILMFVKSVVNPVSELMLNLPKTFIPIPNATTTTCENSFSQYLNCNIISNLSFYENDTFDLYNASVFEPIQCVLNLNFSDNNPLIHTRNHYYNNYVDYNASSSFNFNYEKPLYEWSFLFVILFIIAGGLGNILVCLAVALDRKLQNVTNYFLLSLAIADLLVSLFVMPLGAIPGFLGELFNSFFYKCYYHFLEITF
jgi:hypothetical protein